MKEINQPCIESEIVMDIEAGKAFSRRVGYPVIVSQPIP